VERLLTGNSNYSSQTAESQTVADGWRHSTP